MSHGESVAKSYSQENQNMAPSDVSMAHHPIFKTTHYSVLVIATPEIIHNNILICHTDNTPDNNPKPIHI